MQLIQSSQHKAGPVRLALAAASASLLASTHIHAAENPWLVDTGVLVYSESDGRIKATEPIVSLKKDLGDEHIIDLKFTFDTLTGATPNGAIPSKETVTYTGASGRNSYTTTVGKLPVDKGFSDTRSAFHIGWDQPLGENYHGNLGASYSKEEDFLSNGISAAIARDFNEKNTTLSFGVNLESDTINPVNGIPSAFKPNTYSSTRNESDTKKVNDILIGVSQILSRNWLTQINYSRSNSSGYQNDPYKILSVVDKDGNTIKDFTDTSKNLLLYENRPDKRIRQSIFWGNKIHLTEDVIDISYRHYSDDWGIKANTLDLRYRMEVGKNTYFEPHYRYYKQNAADFYKTLLVSGTDVVNGVSNVQYASSDPRLGDFHGTTFGIKWGYEMGRNSEFSIRYEKYKQSGNSRPNVVKNMSALQGLDFYPGLDASTFMVGYSFEY